MAKGAVVSISSIGTSFGKSGPIIGGGGPERGGGFASVGFARGFGKVGGERTAVSAALKFNASQRFSEGSPSRALNSNFKSFETKRPLRSNLNSRRSELFRVPASGILRTEVIKPRPLRSLLVDTKSAVRWALDRSQRPQRLIERFDSRKSAHPEGAGTFHPEGVTITEEVFVREQALEASVYKKLSAIVGPEKARNTVLEARRYKIGFAKVLTNAQPKEAVSTQTETQTLALTGAAIFSKTESATNSKVTKTRERTQTFAERQQAVSAQKTKEKSLKRDKKTKSQSRIKIFQEYLAAKFARINQARKIFGRIEDENRQKGQEGVSGAQIANEFNYTKDEESLAISQLGREHKDGSHSATRDEIAGQKYITPEKIDQIVNSHAPTEIVEQVTTRKSSDRELAEVFDDQEKIPAAIVVGPGENIIYSNALQAKTEKITEGIAEHFEEKPSGATQVASAQYSEVKGNTVANLPVKIIEPEPLFKKLEDVLGIPIFLKAA